MTKSLTRMAASRSTRPSIGAVMKVSNGSNLPVLRRGHEGLESPRLGRCLASQRRSFNRSDSGRSALAAGTGLHAPHLSFATPVGICPVGWESVIRFGIRSGRKSCSRRLSSIISSAADLPVGPTILIMLSATAAAETATKTRMGKAEASEPWMEQARVTKTEASEPWMEQARVTNAEASEAWTERAAAEPAVPASAKSDGNSDRPSPAPRVTPTPAPWIIRVIPGVILWRITGVILWRIIRIGLRLNGGGCR
jgi:hypothetical protein